MKWFEAGSDSHTNYSLNLPYKNDAQMFLSYDGEAQEDNYLGIPPVLSKDNLQDYVRQRRNSSVIP